MEEPKTDAAAAGADAPQEPAAVPPLTSRQQEEKAMDGDASRPADFEGQLSTTNELPPRETLDKIGEYIVLDRDGKTHTFRSLYSGHNVARRVLVVFVRHFFCGNCQEFLRTLSASITPDALLRLPTSTFLVVVGCGDPALIDMYVEATGCRFPIYTDPTRSLFNELGMVKTLAMGSKPAYMKKSMTKSIVDSIGQALRSVPSGLALKSGDQRQVGGEFLFEPVDAETPLVTPRGNPLDEQDDRPIEEKRVTWCHRMKTTRDHAEIAELVKILGLEQS